jgi:hydrogenase nickel incorporation protein HypA/HybF
MHELPVAEHILELSLKAAQDANAKGILKIHLAIGQLSSFLDESIQFYWDIIAEDTIAKGAQLEFRRIQAKFKCLNCGLDYYITTDNFSCPSCTSDMVKLISGDEFILEAIDIEEAQRE